jgi:uncharacterized membrane protein YqaE (UPF0057 family)
MPSLGCIADDFTGGTDLSGMLVKHGMRAVQIPGQAALNLMLTCCLWLPGNLHALFVVGDINANERTRMIVNAINPQQPQLVAPRQLAVAHKGRVGLIVLAAFFGLAVIGRFHRAEDTYPSTAGAGSYQAPRATRRSRGFLGVL